MTQAEESTAQPATAAKRGRGRGGSRRRTQQRGGIGRGAASGGAGRGGVEERDASASQLRPDAPAFAPSSSDNVPKKSPKNRNKPSENGVGKGRASPRPPKPSKADLKPTEPIHVDMDLTTRLTEAITQETHECMICCDVVRRRHATWACDCCFAILHLGCIKKWAKKLLDEGSQAWRCPACQNRADEVPSGYYCYCRKKMDPPVNRYLTPHACDGLCGKVRDPSLKCPHPCTQPCHPGPCPPCTATMKEMCHCGKKEFVTRCADTERLDGRACAEVCGKTLNCGKHLCDRVCHPGGCGECQVQVEQGCYCSRQERRVVKCGLGIEKVTHVISTEGTAVGARIGWFSCEHPCERWFDCRKHRCSRPCHPQDEVPLHCPLSTDRITHCPCGRTPIRQLIASPRHSCTDPIPTCASACDKILACGHRCASRCHVGECPSCEVMVDRTCRCNATIRKLTCGESTAMGELTCERACERKLACGRHRCITKCCPARAFVLPPGLEGVEAEELIPVEHRCTRICGKKLRCGVHTCPIQCHSGHCPPCLLASFDELACPCGKTRLFPPIACNAKLPRCKFTCVINRRHPPCEHPVPPHPCHPQDEPCPPCTILVTKRCRCGKSEVAHVPCHRAMPSCGQVCNKWLSCGGHRCQRICHDDPCLKDGEACPQLCGKPRQRCRHSCKQRCHAPSLCNETIPCDVQVQLRCPCGRKTLTVPCNKSNGQLACDDMCDKILQLKRMAEALKINRDPETVTLVPPYEEELLDMARADPKFAEKVEQTLIEFVLGPRTTFGFPPMKPLQRYFVHMLAAHYGIDSESQDAEPKRSVFLFKRASSAVPTMMLTDAVTHRSMSDR